MERFRWHFLAARGRLGPRGLRKHGLERRNVELAKPRSAQDRISFSLPLTCPSLLALGAGTLNVELIAIRAKLAENETNRLILEFCPFAFLALVARVLGDRSLTVSIAGKLEKWNIPENNDFSTIVCAGSRIDSLSSRLADTRRFDRRGVEIRRRNRLAPRIPQRTHDRSQ